MQDPIADMLTRIRNGQCAHIQEISFLASTLKREILNVLKEEGYIRDFTEQVNSNGFKELLVQLKYYRGLPVIRRIRRISRPGLRRYKQCVDLASVPGFGVEILTTSKGVMTHHQAKKMQVGGEVICEVA